MGRMGATRLWVRSSSRCITLYGPIWQYVKKLVVVWNMNFMTFHSVGNFMIPTDELIFFRGVETTNQII